MGKQDEFIKTALRVPPDLHKQLHEAAAANNRTFNAEIVSRLQESFVQHATAQGKLPSIKFVSAEATVQRMEEVIKQMESMLMGKPLAATQEAPPSDNKKAE